MKLTNIFGQHIYWNQQANQITDKYKNYSSLVLGLYVLFTNVPHVN